MRPPGPPRRDTLALICMLVLAGGLRTWGLWFGLPHERARPDETEALNLALAILGGDLNPHFFHWPSLHLYVFAAVCWVTDRLHAAMGGARAVDVTTYLLAGRTYVAAAGTLTVLVLARLGHRVAGPRIALLAAACLAVAVLHVRDSHFALTDVVATLLATLSLWALCAAIDRSTSRPGGGLGSPGVSDDAPRRIRLFAMAGIFAGLAASTKYNAAAVAAAMPAAQLILVRCAPAGQRWRVVQWAPAGIYVALFPLAFLAATPFAVLDSRHFMTDLAFDFTHLSGGHGVDLGPGWTYHALVTLPYGLGLGLFGAAVVGAFVMARRRPAGALVLGSFALPFYASVGSGRTVFFRYVLPLFPVLCLAAAEAIDVAGAWLAARTRLERSRATLVVAIVVLAPSLVNSAWLDVLLSRTDTRVMAARWLRQRLPAGATVHETGRDYVRTDLEGVRIHRWDYDPESGAFAGQRERHPDWLIVHTSPILEYVPVPPAIRELAQREYRRVRRFDPSAHAGVRAVYDLQDAFFLPIAGFGNVRRPGPTIEIFQRR